MHNSNSDLKSSEEIRGVNMRTNIYIKCGYKTINTEQSKEQAL